MSGGGLSDGQRRRFDAMLEDVLERLPPGLAELLEESPLVVDDRPEPGLLAELGMDDEPEALCGLH